MKSFTSTPHFDSNPLLQSWDTAGEFPPFAQVKPEYFVPAFKFAMDAQRAEIAFITNNSNTPTFANTIQALDQTGTQLSRIAMLFDNLTDSASTPDLQNAELALAGPRAAFASEVFTNTALFQRIDTLAANQDSLGLSEEQTQLLRRFHLDFVRAGAMLSEQSRQRLGEIAERLAQLFAQF